MLINRVVDLWFKRRQEEIDYFCNNPVQVQERELMSLVEYAAETEFGVKYDFKSIDSTEKFQQRVPVCDYESFVQYIDRARLGEKNIIWPTAINWFAKSSGTTSNKSKFIPVSVERNRHCPVGSELARQQMGTRHLGPGSPGPVARGRAAR